MTPPNDQTQQLPAASSATQHAAPATAARRPRGTVAYLVSRFPKITETFIVREMRAVEQAGVRLELYPLRRERTTLVQPEAEPFVRRAKFRSLLGPGVLWNNLNTGLRSPTRYLTTLATLVRANWGSPRYLTAALTFFPLAVDIARRMRADGIQHIHAHFASHPAAVAWTIWRFTNIPYSFVAHGSDLHRDQHMLLEKTRDAAFVVAISDYNRRMILDVCGQHFGHKVRVVHCGIDPQQFIFRQSPTPFSSGKGTFRIVCVGTLHEVKGQSYLIEACSLLSQQGVSFACHLLGDGPDRAALEEQVKALGLQRHVTFHGHTDSIEVANQLQQADCLVTPSVLSRDGRREGIPVVLMEAMASGVPCIASQISGIPELIEHEETGLLAPPKDATAIATAIQRLIDDAPLRSKLAAQAVRRVNSDFHADKNACLLAHLFETWEAGQHTAVLAESFDHEMEPSA